MKPLVVIISGSFIKTPPILSPLAKLYCHYFGISLSSDHNIENLQTYIQKTTTFDTVIFPWSRKVTRNLTQIADQLTIFLNKYSEYKQIILMGKSLGGTIAEIASHNPHFPNTVSKIVFIATPHPSKKVTHLPSVKKINIYSPEDNYVSVAKKALYRNFHSNNVENAEDIVLPNVRHSTFNKNIVVDYRGKKIKLFNLYLSLIT